MAFKSKVSMSIATNPKASSLSRRGSVYATLLTTIHAKIEAFVEWAWDYLGVSRDNAILDELGRIADQLERRRGRTSRAGASGVVPFISSFLLST